MKLMDAPNAVLERPTRTRVGPSSRGVAGLGEADRGQIYRLWLQGVAPEVLADRFGISRAGVGRIVNETRARRLLEQKLEYMPNPEFDDPSRRDAILAPMPEPARAPRRNDVPEGLPPYLASLYNLPLLSAEQERHLFRKMNFLKCLAYRLRQGLDPAKARASELDRIERLQEEALAVKNQIIRSNLRLVVSIAKKRIGPKHDFFELVSDGNVSLIRAVEKFDYARGNKFSTYASWAIMKNFGRSIPGESQHLERFRTGHEEVFDAAADNRADERESEAAQKQSREVVRGILGRLDDRERRVIVHRYGIGGADEQTLEQLGRQLGVTKERVRQIESRAHEKLRKFAAEQKIDADAALL